jgi:hypothetical protein
MNFLQKSLRQIILPQALVVYLQLRCAYLILQSALKRKLVYLLTYLRTLSNSAKISVIVA